MKSLLVLLVSVPLLAQAHAQVPVKASRTQVVLLGTGTPNDDPNRWGPAVAIVVDEEVYLVDACLLYTSPSPRD